MLTVKNTKILLIVLAIAIITGSIVYNKLAVNRQAVKTIDPELATNFNKEHINLIRIDTFEHLLNKAYGDQMEIKRSGTLMEVFIFNHNNVAKDFYNGNNALLEYSLNDHNFELKFTEGDQKLQGRFKIKDGGVFVPNDVLIRLIEKNYN